MRRRLVAAAVTLLLFSWLALLGAYNIHQLLSHQALFSYRMAVCLQGLTIPTIRTWFLLLEGCGLLLISWMLFGREYIKYKSKMIQICPGIETPKAEGQGQYGTARWLTVPELERSFTVVEVDRHTPLLRKLVRLAQDDLEGEGT